MKAQIYLIYSSLRQPFAFEVNAAIARASEGFISIREEDPEDWLNVDPSDFDTMLKQAVGHTQAVHTSETREDVVMPSPEDIEDHVANQQAERLRNLAKKVESFMEGEGDLEGAQFEE